MSNIEFKDIRAGDRVRFTNVDGDVTKTIEFTAKGRCPVYCLLDSNENHYVLDGGDHWELIERPKPEPKPGQIWEMTGQPFPGKRYLTCRSLGPVLVRFLGLDADNLTMEPSFWGNYADHLKYVGEAEIGVKP